MFLSDVFIILVHWWQEGETREHAVSAKLSLQWRCRPFCVDQESIPSHEITTMEYKKFFAIGKYTWKKYNFLKIIIIIVIIFVFSDVFITSIWAKNYSHTQWIAAKWMTALSNCRTRTISGSSFGITAIRNEYHSLSTPTWSA